MELIYFLVGVTVLILLVLTYFIFNLLNRNERLELQLLNSQDKFSELMDVAKNQSEAISIINKFVDEGNTLLKDNKLYGAFSNDDEIGSYFRFVNQMQEELNKFKTNTNNWNPVKI